MWGKKPENTETKKQKPRQKWLLWTNKGGTATTHIQKLTTHTHTHTHIQKSVSKVDTYESLRFLHGCHNTKWEKDDDSCAKSGREK